MDTLGDFYGETDFCDKLANVDYQLIQQEAFNFADEFGLTGEESSIDFSSYLAEANQQNEASTVSPTRQTDNFILDNFDNLFTEEERQMQHSYPVVLSNVKQEPVTRPTVDLPECEMLSNQVNQSNTMPQQSYFNLPSTGSTGNDNNQSPYASQVSSPTSTTTSFKSSPPSKTSSKSCSGKRQRHVPQKGSNEYFSKREKNNVAVRKSREKSKKNAVQLQSRVKELTTDNDRLNKKVELLTKELTVLKGLFTNVGKSAPHELKSY